MKQPQDSSRRRSGARFGVSVQVLLACVLLVAVNYAGFHYYYRGDWSPAQKYRPSELTKNALKRLPATAKVYVFFSPTTAAPGYEVYGDVVNLLKEYQVHAGDKLTVEYIDPMRNLGRARELQAKFQFGPEENLVIVEMDGRSKQVSAIDMAEYDYLTQITGEPPRLRAFKGEQALTSALLEVSEPKQRKVYFLQGQGEAVPGDGSPISLLVEYIEKQGVKAALLSLTTTPAIPEDAGAVIIAGARYDLPAETAKVLREYWEKNGRLIVLLDPDASTPLLKELLAAAGINPRDDRVLRTVQLGFATGILRDVAGKFSPANRVTRRLQGADAMFPAATCSLELDERKEGVAVAPMVTAEDPFWAETEHVTDEKKGVRFEEGKDTAAPVVIAAMAERGAAGEEQLDLSSSRMVVAGNCEFVADGSITEPNLDFVLSSLNWMLDRGHLARIAPKSVRAFNLNLTDSETGRIALYTLVVIPMLAALAGLAVWWRRRR
ncbi:MAG: GldG family protein [Chthoniobacterales bacterium]